jgi:hypothetical protein
VSLGLHYEAAPPPPPDPAVERARWEQIRAQHKSLGYFDIAYNHGTGDSGTLLTGRGWDRDTAANGPGHNAGGRTIVWLGDNAHIPSPAALRTIVAWKAEAWKRGYTGQLVPHSFFVPTQCCGDYLRGWLASGMPLDNAADWADVWAEIERQLAMGKIAIIQNNQTGALYAYDGMVKDYLGSPDRLQILKATGHITETQAPVPLLPQQIDSIPDCASVVDLEPVEGGPALTHDELVDAVKEGITGTVLSPAP